MKVVLGIVAVAALYAAGQTAFPTHGTVQAPNAYWLALALTMSAIGGGVYLRAKLNERGARTLAAEASA